MEANEQQRWAELELHRETHTSVSRLIERSGFYAMMALELQMRLRMGVDAIAALLVVVLTLGLLSLGAVVALSAGALGTILACVLVPRWRERLYRKRGLPLGDVRAWGEEAAFAELLEGELSDAPASWVQCTHLEKYGMGAWCAARSEGLLETARSLEHEGTLGEALRMGESLSSPR